MTSSLPEAYGSAVVCASHCLATEEPYVPFIAPVTKDGVIVGKVCANLVVGTCLLHCFCWILQLFGYAHSKIKKQKPNATSPKNK